MNKEITIYTDGSYSCTPREGAVSDVTKVRKYGYAFVTSDGFTESGIVPEPWRISNNIGPEVYAVLRALNYCVLNKITHVKIVHDYEGCAHWITGQWNTNKPVSITYKMQVEKMCTGSGIELTFEWTKGHAGNTLNERADALALAARG